MSIIKSQNCPTLGRFLRTPKTLPDVFGIKLFMGFHKRFSRFGGILEGFHPPSRGRGPRNGLSILHVCSCKNKRCHLYPLLTITNLWRYGIMATKRESYEQRFREYPDVVTLPQFREMMGRIGDCTARKLMQGNHVRHYYIRNTYLIPKAWVIDYILSSHYAEYKKELKVQV